MVKPGGQNLAESQLINLLGAQPLKKSLCNDKWTTNYNFEYLLVNLPYMGRGKFTSKESL